MKMAARRVGRDNAEDIVQQAFEELLAGSENGDDPLVYLVRRVRNRSREAQRLDRRRAAILLRDYAPSDSRLRKLQADYSPTAEGDFRGRDDDPEIDGFRPGELMGYPYNKLGETTWS